MRCEDGWDVLAFLLLCILLTVVIVGGCLLWTLGAP